MSSLPVNPREITDRNFRQAAYPVAVERVGRAEAERGS